MTSEGFNEEVLSGLDSPLAARVELHQSIRSTQERAWELARGGTPHGTLVLAVAQTRGRGRLGRRWSSPPGGIWMSLVLRPNLMVKSAARITQAAAVGVAKGLRESGVEAVIKWPNDVLVSGRKLAGILAESSVDSAPVQAKRVGVGGGARRVEFVVLGVGVNANLDPEQLRVEGREVTSLRAELGHDVDLNRLLAVLLSNTVVELERAGEDFQGVLDDWRVLNCTLGKTVSFQRFGQKMIGMALDVGPEGSLLVQTGGEVLELFEGEVEHLRPTVGDR